MYEIEDYVLEDLFEFIKHGDDNHRQWLWQALKAFRDGNPRPAETVGDGGTKD